MEFKFLAIATLALFPVLPTFLGGGDAIPTHGVMVTMLTVVQCLFLVQSILQPNAKPNSLSNLGPAFQRC